MELTGERVIPDKMDRLNNLLLEHIGRYHFAANHTRGKVLDLACGVGYGSFLIAKYCKKKVDEIIGIDYDPETISYATKTYNHPRCSFFVDDALDFDLVDKYGNFDTIISFETLEHLDDDQAFLRNLQNLLHPGGRLIISTPLGAGRNFPSKQPFHKFQLTEDEFAELFIPFDKVEFFSQQGLVFTPYQEEDNYPIMIAIAKL